MWSIKHELYCFVQYDSNSRQGKSVKCLFFHFFCFKSSFFTGTKATLEVKKHYSWGWASNYAPTSIEWSTSENGRTTILGVDITDRISRRNPPKYGTTLQSRISSAALTASLYSTDGSRQNIAADSVCRVDKSSSDSSNQNGFNFSDLKKDVFIWKHVTWIGPTQKSR